MSLPHVVTIILNTNRRDDTLACLASLATGTYERHTVLVLDNASTDGSVAAIREHFPAVEIVALQANKGYAGNNNVGIAAALAKGADWVFVLNEDTILAPDCIAQLVAIGESSPQIGIVGPLVFHHDEPGVVQSAGGRMGKGWDAWHLAQNEPYSNQFAGPQPVDWVSGCAIMVRRAVIEQVGPLDERFFYYWEETEWCLRARLAGWQIQFVPQAQLWHKGVQRDYRPKPSVAYYDTRNHLLMMAKHHAPLSAWLVTGSRRLRTLASYSLRPKWRAKKAHRDAIIRGWRDFFLRRLGKSLDY
jgi:GT2 family glycosyltransferase